MTDIVMKEDSKPDDSSKPQEVVQEEPHDHFYGKHILFLKQYRTKEKFGFVRKSLKWEGFSLMLCINQKFEKT